MCIFVRRWLGWCGFCWCFCSPLKCNACVSACSCGYLLRFRATFVFIRCSIYSLHYDVGMKVLAHTYTCCSQYMVERSYQWDLYLLRAGVQQPIYHGKNNVIAAVWLLLLLSQCINCRSQVRTGVCVAPRYERYIITIIWVRCGKSYTIKANDDR